MCSLILIRQIRLLFQNEIDELKKNLRDIVHNTEFNTHKLLTNTVPGEYVFADHSISVERSASTVSVGGNAVTGSNTAKLEPSSYTKQAKIVSNSRIVEEVTASYPSVNGKVTTVMDHKPRWSADGETIVFQSTRDGQQYIVLADGSADPKVDANTVAADTRKEVGDYRLEMVNSSLQLQKRSGSDWTVERSYTNYNTADGLHGYNFAPSANSDGKLSFAFSDSDGNISKVVIDTQTGSISSPVSVIPNTDKLNLPPINNTVSLGGTPDLYRMNEVDASLVVHKVTDSGPQQLTYWDGTGTAPEFGYYMVNGSQITFHEDAKIGFDPISEDDAQDYYTF